MGDGATDDLEVLRSKRMIRERDAAEKLAAAKPHQRITDLERTLSDLLYYAKALSSESSDPGAGALCAIYNAETLLGQR